MLAGTEKKERGKAKELETSTISPSSTQGKILDPEIPL